jgi:hypothetical protein
MAVREVVKNGYPVPCGQQLTHYHAAYVTGTARNENLHMGS